MNDPNCPENCPNRSNAAAQAQAQKATKWAAYAFAAFCAFFVSWQQLSAEKRGEQLSPIVFMPLLVLAGTAIGVNIDPSEIASLLNKNGGA